MLLTLGEGEHSLRLAPLFNTHCRIVRWHKFLEPPYVAALDIASYVLSGWLFSMVLVFPTFLYSVLLVKSRGALLPQRGRQAFFRGEATLFLWLRVSINSPVGASEDTSYIILVCGVPKRRQPQRPPH